MKQHLRSFAAAAMFLSALAGPVLAEQQPQGGVHDQRIMTFEYFEDDVYPIETYTGYALTLIFEETESVIYWIGGDLETWEVAPLSYPNHLSVKVKRDIDQPTNLNVRTSRRHYTFVLTSHTGTTPEGVGFRYSFRYPEPEIAETVKPRSIFEVHRNATGTVNLDYAAVGSNLLRPVQVFDDGVKTYIRLPPRSVRPSIFAMEIDGYERTINSGDYLDDGTIVVNGVYSRLVLRDGPYVTCLFNRPLYAYALENAPETPAQRDTNIQNDPRDGK
ncbi:TrbG/VirB9 family P-type conjugative transfer protein [Pelagibius sp. Alg239-R121]|uniref:TrbG/VirB9 family P-type conjugative transfer protein n=1 Tax=Pelagibius sp. Alg239-R121 TaxID=2993448 RepID=UPI0024A6D92A|nr:TrbG/VirB9 family P-type conjugative transfer protein [Pelagibius sp. Alg239-R121]